MARREDFLTTKASDDAQHITERVSPRRAISGDPCTHTIEDRRRRRSNHETASPNLTLLRDKSSGNMQLKAISIWPIGSGLPPAPGSWQRSLGRWRVLQCPRLSREISDEVARGFTGEGAEVLDLVRAVPWAAGGSGLGLGGGLPHRDSAISSCLCGGRRKMGKRGSWKRQPLYK